MGYRFQFITLAGWHALNLSMFELATAYRDDGMYGYSQLQQREFGLEHAGYRAAKHQAFVGTGYFDAVQTAITAGQCSTAALIGSTEQEQFNVAPRGGDTRSGWSSEGAVDAVMQTRAGAAVLAAAPALPGTAESPVTLAASIAEHFRRYNEAFGVITRRAAIHFMARTWSAAQADAVSRIDLYEQWVGHCHTEILPLLADRQSDLALWSEIKRQYEALIRRLPDSDFYRTFFNSITRDLFGTVGVNPAVEFTATSAGRACGAVPIRVYPVGDSLQAAVRDIVADLPFADAVSDTAAIARQITTELGRHFDSRRQSASPQSIEIIEPPFYRGHTACIVGRLIGDGAMTPLVLSFEHGVAGVAVSAVMLARNEISSLFGFSRSYFHVDLPVVSAAVTMLRGFMPHKPVDELYTVLGRAKQGKTERYFALRRQLDVSFDTFVNAPGQRGLVMIVFTLPSHDLVFKVIRDRFGAPKNSTRSEVMERYQLVFHHDRAGRLVDAQEFHRLRLPRARFMPGLLDELLTQAAQSCSAGWR